MISPDILFRLVPSRPPDDDFPRDRGLLELVPGSPGQIISVWSEYLRYRISRELIENKELEKLVETSGFIGTGVFRIPNSVGYRSFETFPIVNGFQFGAVLLRGARVSTSEGDYLGSIPLESGQIQAPVIQTVATFNPHACQTSDGFVAAVYKDDNLEECGITAGHVVANYNVGQRVPVLCSVCGSAGRLAAKAPGLIDAAKITFPCGGPAKPFGKSSPIVRGAAEGETVEAHFGYTGKALCTIMLSLSTPSQITSAAVPKHFLTDLHGNPGDSGSLVSGPSDGSGEPDLIGMYLGDTNCRDENDCFATYGYGLDLQQAADILGASNLQGEFSV